MALRRPALSRKPQLACRRTTVNVLLHNPEARLVEDQTDRLACRITLLRNTSAAVRLRAAERRNWSVEPTWPTRGRVVAAFRQSQDRVAEIHVAEEGVPKHLQAGCRATRVRPGYQQGPDPARVHARHRPQSGCRSGRSGATPPLSSGRNIGRSGPGLRPGRQLDVPGRSC